MHVRLSKSKIATFEHCPKRLWLQAYRRELGALDERTKYLFAAGHRLGELARNAITGGLLVDTDPRKVDLAIDETRRLIADGWSKAIFEAAFVRDDVVIRTDILQPDGWGGWQLTEVKNCTRVRDYVLRDVGTQLWVLRKQPLCISSVSIRHVSRRVTMETDAARVTFIDEDVTDRIKELVAWRHSVVERARAVLQGPEPQRAVGSHCSFPFRCEFQAYCQSGEDVAAK